MKQSEKNLKIYIFLLVIFFILAIFELINVSNCDKDFHMTRLAELAIQLRQIGIFKYPFYINFSAFNNMGYALETFYSDFYLIIPAIFINHGIELNILYAILVIISFALILISSFFAYKFFYNNKKNAMFYSLIYSFSNFILFEIFERNALGTNFAYIFVPWILFSFLDIFQENNKKYDYIILGISMSCLILSHIQTSIIVTLGLLIYTVVNFRKCLKNKNIIFIFIKAVLICILLDAFFIFPMFEQMIFQKLYVISNPFSYMKNSYINLCNIILPNFLWSNLLTSVNTNSVTLFIQSNWSIPSCFMPTIFMYVYITKNIKNEFYNKKIFIAYIFISVLFFMSFTNIVSYIKLFDFLQFPWRFITLIAIILPITFVNIESISDKVKETICYITLINAIIYIFFLSFCFYQPNHVVQATIGQGEYLPEEIPSKDFANQYTTNIKCDNYGNYYKIDLSLTEEKQEFELPIVYYKGYKLYETDENYNKLKNIEFSKSNNGLITISNTESNYLLAVYEGTIIQKVSKYISVFTIISLIIIFCRRYIISKYNIRIKK